MEAMAEIHSCPDISIHAPREGSDSASPRRQLVYSRFLSTLPVRGATCLVFVLFLFCFYFYPRSP